MRPIEFPQQNRVWAKDQPEYNPLPAYTDHERTISCWHLTWRERFRVLFGGRLWLSQRNLGHPLQAVALETESPFVPPTPEGETP